MSNRGTLSGLNDANYSYQDFDPFIKAFKYIGSATDPVLGNGSAWARFQVKPSGLVHYYGAIEFGSTSTYGATDEVWGLRLPVPANRSSGGADIPIGTAWTRKALTDDPCPTMSLVPTLMDPMPGQAYQTEEDNYAQFFVPYLLSYGTGTITVTTGNTITHNLGNSASGYTPAAYDVHTIATEVPSTNTGAIICESTSSTQASFAVKADPGASDLDFAWKIRSEPNQTGGVLFTLLMSYGHPWRQSTGHVIGWNLEYEARR